MNRRAIFAFLPLVLAAQNRQKEPKGPDVELLEAAARVEDRRVNIDGRVRNASEKPVRKLRIIFEVLDSDGNVLTKQQGTIDEPVLEPGAESLFQAQMAYHARAVSFRVSFEDGSGRDLRSERTGPFPIE